MAVNCSLSEESHFLANVLEVVRDDPEEDSTLVGDIDVENTRFSASCERTLCLETSMCETASMEVRIVIPVLPPKKLW